MKTPKIDPELQVCVDRLDPAMKYIAAVLPHVKKTLFLFADGDPEPAAEQLPIYGGYTRTIELISASVGLLVQGQNQVAYSVLHAAFQAWGETTWLYACSNRQIMNSYIEIGLPARFNVEAEVQAVPYEMKKRGVEDIRLEVLCTLWADHFKTLRAYTASANQIVGLDQYTLQETFPLQQRKNLLDASALLSLHATGILAMCASEFPTWEQTCIQFDKYVASGT